MSFIEKIEIKTSCSCFKDGTEIPFSTDGLNVIYGSNGCGKTSITKVLSLLSNEYLLEEKEKTFNSLKTLKSPTDMNIICRFKDENVNIGNPFIDCKKDIYIFNRFYIKDKIQIDDFSSNKFDINAENIIKGKIKNPLEEDYLMAKAKLEKAKNEEVDFKTKTIESDEQKIKEEIDVYKRKVNSNKNKDLIFSSVTEQMKYDNLVISDGDRLLEKYSTYNSVDEEEIIEPIFEKSKIDQYFEIKKQLLDQICYSEDLSKSEFAANFVTNYSDEIQTWIKNGIDMMNDNQCPFCHQELSEYGQKMINDFKAYSNTQVSSIKENLINICSKIKSLDDDFKLDRLKSVFFKYQNLIDDVTTITEKIEEIEKNIKEMKKLLLYAVKLKMEEKNLCRNISKEVDFSSFTETIYSDYELLVKEYVILTDKIKKSNKNKKYSRDQYINDFVIPSLANKYKNDYEKHALLVRKVSIEKEQTEKKKTVYKEDLKKKQPLIVKINQILKDIGLIKFNVDENFNLILNDKSISKSIDEYLSDGERTIIAFCIFISEIDLKYSHSNSLVVIDDPISSLDYDHIYSVKSFIEDLFQKYKSKIQFVILTHNSIFYNMLKYRNEGQNNFGKLDISDTGTIYIRSKEEASLYIEKLRFIYCLSKRDNQDFNALEKSCIPNNCRYIIEFISNFLYPKTNNPIGTLEKHVRSSSICSRNKSDTLFYAIQIGSHSILNTSLDGETIITNSQYKDICTSTIAIVKHFCKTQIENIDNC